MRGTVSALCPLMQKVDYFVVSRTEVNYHYPDTNLSQQRDSYVIKQEPEQHLELF